jgi:universal stress protein A
MSNYKHILLAADFSRHGLAVAERAKDLANLYQAKLSITHIVDNLVTMDMAYEPSIAYDFDLSAELMASAKNHLSKLADQFNIPENQRWLEIGNPKMEIVRIAEENQADLIVIGSHGRHGLALLLGSTANGVLHHAKCDVLAVRLQNDD